MLVSAPRVPTVPAVPVLVASIPAASMPALVSVSAPRAPAVPTPAATSASASAAVSVARAARAREVLARAERRTGTRSVHVDRFTGRTVDRLAAQPGAQPGAQSADRPAVWVRPVLASVAPDGPARSGLVAADRSAFVTADRPALAVPPALAALLPEGLRRGETAVVAGSTSLVLTLLAHACAHGAWGAVVGRPDLGVLAASQAGVDLDRLAMVPSPGADAPTVVAALLDGLDVVIVGQGARLTDADRRRLTARARDRGAVLVSMSTWPGAGVRLTATSGQWTGVGAGDGWLCAHRLRVTRTGRGVGAPLTVDVTLGTRLSDEPARLSDELATIRIATAESTAAMTTAVTAAENALVALAPALHAAALRTPAPRAGMAAAEEPSELRLAG